MNPAVYFRARQKILTKEQALEAYNVTLPRNPAETDVTIKSIATIDGVGITLKRNECIRFCDWILASGIDHPRLWNFLVMIVRAYSLAGARRIANQSGKIDRKTISYYHDAISSIALSILFGGAGRRILKLENWEPDKPVTYSYIERRVRKENPNKTVETLVTKTHETILINGSFRVLATDLLMRFVESYEGEWFVLSEHPDSECWKIGNKVRKHSNRVRMAIGMARSNFVALEVGRMLGKYEELAVETRDSRRSRDVEDSLSYTDMVEGFLAVSTADEQSKAILMVELDRPHVQQGFYQDELPEGVELNSDEREAYRFYVARTNDQPHRTSYHDKLMAIRNEFSKYVLGLKDLSSTKLIPPPPIMTTGYPVVETRPQLKVTIPFMVCVNAHRFGSRWVSGVGNVWTYERPGKANNESDYVFIQQPEELFGVAAGI